MAYPAQETKNSSNHTERSQADKKGRSPYPAPPPSADGATAQLSLLRGPWEAVLAPHSHTPSSAWELGTQAGCGVGRGCTQGSEIVGTAPGTKQDSGK